MDSAESCPIASWYAAQAEAENTRSKAAVAKGMRCGLIFSLFLYYPAESPFTARTDLPKRKYREGSTNRFSSVEVTSPPRITIAMGCSIS